MGRIIKTFSDGTLLEYDMGRFDPWCVYVKRSGGVRWAPKDTDYFTRLKQLADRYGADRVYGDYVRIYDQTGKRTEARTLNLISQIADSYGNDALMTDIVFSAIYMAMISEENKLNAPLGKRMKRLGIHKLLIENCSVRESAESFHRKEWRELEKLCKERGF